jgi:hypothetical protein
VADNTFQPLAVDDLLKQLKDTPVNMGALANKPTHTSTPPVSAPYVDEEDLGKLVIQQASNLIMQSMGVLNEIKDVVIAGNDPETICAYADLMKSTNASLETLNKIYIQNKKAKTSKEIARINAEAKKNALENNPSQTNILIGTREEVLKMMGEITKKTLPDSVMEAEVVSSETISLSS